MHSSHAVEREWGGASSYCIDSSAQLASVSGDSDDDTLRFMSVLSRRSFPAPLSNPLTVWVGSPMGNHLTHSFSMHQYQQGSNCIGLNATRGKLSESACTEKYTFICERGKSFHPFFTGCRDRSVFFLCCARGGGGVGEDLSRSKII